MPSMKGAELICEFLIQEKIPYVFGICGHGNAGSSTNSITCVTGSGSSLPATSRPRGTWPTPTSAWPTGPWPP
jgi:hypothetical protein